MLRTLRYARSWKGGAQVSIEETEIERDGEPIPATVFTPQRADGPLPGWIALGGISRMGRHHPQLVRFAGSLASTGATVLVPEIPEWRRLELSPQAVSPTLVGSIDFLNRQTNVADAPFGLIGFSFGAPQAAVAAGQGQLGKDIGGMVLFGGYCSLERTMTCQLTGEHEWDGSQYRLDPDPFGGWVVGSNHLTRVPGFEDAQPVATALHRLADAASGQRIPAWDSRHDPLIRELREGLSASHQSTFDLFAIPSHQSIGRQEDRRRMALLLAEACRRAEPLMDPGKALSQVAIPTRLIHGRGDRLIPFTEAHRLQAQLPDATCLDATVTALFDHTADSKPSRWTDRASEGLKLFSAIRGMINLV